MWREENRSFWAISSFVTMFSKSRLLQRRQKASIWGKGLKQYFSYISWHVLDKLTNLLEKPDKSVMCLSWQAASDAKLYTQHWVPEREATTIIYKSLWYDQNDADLSSYLFILHPLEYKFSAKLFSQWHTTILQQTTLKTYWQKPEKSP